MKNQKAPGGVKSAIFSAIAILATIAITLIFTSFKDRSETTDTQNSEYATVSDADTPNLNANNSEVKNHYQPSNPPQNANVAVLKNPKYVEGG